MGFQSIAISHQLVFQGLILVRLRFSGDGGRKSYPENVYTMPDVLPGQLKNLGGWVVERRFRVLILRLKIVPVASGLERRWRGAGIRHEKIRRTKIGYAGVGYVCWGAWN